MHEPARKPPAVSRVAALWLVAACGCSGPTSTAPASAPGSAARLLRVAAASDLRGALPELIAGFERDTPGVKVEPVFGSSGHLAGQINEGAPFDLFLAANLSFVKALADSDVVSRQTVRPYAVGSLVLAVRADAGVAVSGVADVAKPAVRKVAIADPATAPYGLAAKQALGAAGLSEKVGPKLVTAGSVLQALQFVETGNADVAFVGRALTKGKGVRVVDVDPALYDPIVQALGVVAASGRRGDAEAFAAFVTGPQGQSVLRSFGFKPPPAGPP